MSNLPALPDVADNNPTLFNDVTRLIDSSRERVARTINSEISALYWEVGRRISQDVLLGERAEYGKEVLKNLSKQLTNVYGKGWSVQQLRHCVKFAAIYPDEQIVSALWRQFNWSIIKIIIYIDEPIKRDFFIEMCKLGNWSSRQLQENVNSLLFERTALSKRPELIIEKEIINLRNEGILTPDFVFRDPYFLNYAGLPDIYSEKDVEDVIVSDMSRFISELGCDFAFVARQKRMRVDRRDYYLDLLFFHRGLNCLVAIELKVGEFSAADKGQMELYLRWLEKYEMGANENLPIGLILCTGKSEGHIELMRLEESNIRVAEYLTKLPDMKVLENRLRHFAELARANARTGQP